MATYAANLASLPAKEELHWRLRLFRTGLDQTGGARIKALFFKQAAAVIPVFASARDSGSCRDLGLKLLLKIKKNSPRQKKRLEVYRQVPEVLVHMRLLLFLFLVKSLKMQNHLQIKPFYDAKIDFYRKNPTVNLFLRDDFVLANPSQTANLIYYLIYLGLENREVALIAKFKKYFLEEIPKNRDDWLYQVYALTHLFIAASDYYQHFLESQKFAFALNFFENNFSRVLLETTPDVVAEAGLAFKLCRDFHHPVVAKIKAYLAGCFDPQKGYLPKERNDSLAKAEHRNIMAVMVLEDFVSLFPGPDLSLI
jgi:hypothetical protein